MSDFFRNLSISIVLLAAIIVVTMIAFNPVEKNINEIINIDTTKVDTVMLNYQYTIDSLHMVIINKEKEAFKRIGDINRLFVIIDKLSDPNTPKEEIEEIKVHYKQENY